MRILSCLCLLLVIGAAKAQERESTTPARFKDHMCCVTGRAIHNETNNTVTQQFAFAAAGQLGRGVPIETVCIDPGDIVYINGIKYDWGNAYQSPVDRRFTELVGWYGVCGYARATRRKDGGWDFNSVTGEEQKAAWEHFHKGLDPVKYAGPISAWKELGHTGATKKRLTTIAECRDLWRKIDSGEIKATQAENKVWHLKEIPAGQRVPLKPKVMDEDPRSLPIIPVKPVLLRSDTVLVSAPAPKWSDKPESAPMPREMFPYTDASGNVRFYARQQWQNGRLVKVIREGDSEFERRSFATPVPPNGIVQENCGG